MYNDKPIRRSQLINPWGVGAIVPFPNDESLMIAGLDRWRYNDSQDFLIIDERLQKRLGVSELRWPPDLRSQASDPTNYNLTIPAVRFPTWLYCPFCGTMQKSSYIASPLRCDCHQWSTGRNCDPKSRNRRLLIPERFIVVCPDGHVDDFPVAEWLHSGSEHSYDEKTCRIRRSTGGASASLSGIYYECSCGARKSIAGATREGALKKIGYRCKGTMPWLGITENTNEPCNREDVVVLLRGATNVWFADTRSSIHLPNEINSESKRIIDIVDKYISSIKSKLVNGDIPKDIISFIAENENVNPAKLINAFILKIEEREEIEDSKEISEDEYRLTEYNVLTESSGNDTLDFYSINNRIQKYDKSIQPYFKSISLIKKLRETRALIGFSRLMPDDTNISKHKKMLRLGNDNWLPAIEVYGEGLFFQFDDIAVKKWAAMEKVKSRLQKLNSALNASIYKLDGSLQAEYVLIHTFAHLLINQLSLECGYGSSSLRERVYCEKVNHNLNMYGILIYTASGDSEGSLGGLVRLGEPGRIENSIITAIQNAKWCSSDPICINSSGQGPDSCNLAACYNCSLVSETSCENGNRMLDRGVVVGTLEDTEIGYFHNMLY